MAACLSRRWATGWGLACLIAASPALASAPAAHAKSAATAPPGDGAREPAWLARARLAMPDLPVRWDERVVRYLEYFRDDPHGHATLANLLRRSGRWRGAMRAALRSRGLPEDLVWVSMIESGFDPAARSPAGAAGLWQLMPETARIHGLTLDRWLDERLDPARSTEAAAELLGDLHRRFGSWELALAGFNMGYARLVSIVRRYDTNDFWSLARIEGALPWETTLYIPKILAAAIVAHNLAAFGFGGLTIDPPADPDRVAVRGRLGEAHASARPAAPPGDEPSVVVPAETFAYPDRRRVFYRVQVGDVLPDVAAALHVTADDLRRWNDLDAGARLQDGMTLQAFTPKDADLSNVVVMSESDVRVLPIGSEELFAAVERDQGVRRITVAAEPGDTLASIGRRYDVRPSTMERINRRGRGEALRPGDRVVVYVPNGPAAGGAPADSTASNAPAPDGPLPPLPDLLP